MDTVHKSDADSFGEIHAETRIAALLIPVFFLLHGVLIPFPHTTLCPLYVLGIFFLIEMTKIEVEPADHKRGRSFQFEDASQYKLLRAVNKELNMVVV
jgi:hypothetical protein